MAARISTGGSGTARFNAAKRKHEDAVYRYGPDSSAARLAEQEVIREAEAIGIRMENESNYESFLDRIWPDNAWHLLGVSGPGKKGDAYRASQTPPTWQPAGSDAQRRQAATYRGRGVPTASAGGPTNVTNSHLAGYAPVVRGVYEAKEYGAGNRPTVQWTPAGGASPAATGQDALIRAIGQWRQQDATAAAQAASAAQEAAFQAAKRWVSENGLDGFAQFYPDIKAGRMTFDEALEEFRGTDAYAARFPAMAALKKAGMGMTEGQYIELERSYRTQLKNAGVPADAFGRDDIAELMVGDVSPTEAASRAQMAVTMVESSDMNVLRAFKQYYGIGKGDLVAYFLDPDKQLPRLQKKAQAALIGAESLRADLRVGRGFAEELASEGIDQGAARSAFQRTAAELPDLQDLASIEGGSVSKRGVVEANLGMSSADETRIEGLRSRERARFARTSAGTNILGSDTSGSY